MVIARSLFSQVIKAKERTPAENKAEISLPLCVTSLPASLSHSWLGRQL
jgi:hypothetical protein